MYSCHLFKNQNLPSTVISSISALKIFIQLFMAVRLKNLNKIKIFPSSQIRNERTGRKFSVAFVRKVLCTRFISYLLCIKWIMFYSILLKTKEHRGQYFTILCTIHGFWYGEFGWIGSIIVKFVYSPLDHICDKIIKMWSDGDY